MLETGELSGRLDLVRHMWVAGPRGEGGPREERWGEAGTHSSQQPPSLFWQVGSVLEQSSPWQQCRGVSLPPEVLGSSWDPETPAWVLLEECGLEVQADAPQVRWEPQAQERTCALFACLLLLLGLSPDSCWG